MTDCIHFDVGPIFPLGSGIGLCGLLYAATLDRRKLEFPGSFTMMGR